MIVELYLLETWRRVVRVEVDETDLPASYEALETDEDEKVLTYAEDQNRAGNLEYWPSGPPEQGVQGAQLLDTEIEWAEVAGA